MEKYGQNATVLAGEVSRIGRHPLISTMAMPLTEADGNLNHGGQQHEGTGGDVQPACVRCWLAPGVKVETERLPGTDQTRIVYSPAFGDGAVYPNWRSQRHRGGRRDLQHHAVSVM